MNGNVIPFVGIKCIEEAMFIKICKENWDAIPIIATVLKELLWLQECMKDLIIINKKRKITMLHITNPNSSPITEKIKSA